MRHPTLLLLCLTGCAPSHPTVNADPSPIGARDAALENRIRAVLDAFSDWGPVLSPDGKEFLFVSDRGGSAELFLGEVGHPERAAVRLVAGPERVASAVFTHDGKAVLYRQDHGANEDFHIFRVPVAGGAPIDLSPPEPMWRDSPLLPRERADLMVYGARHANDYASMILVQDLDGGAAKVVYRDKLPGTAIDVAPDGSRALWIREAVVGGHELLEVDLATGKARQVAPRACPLRACAEGDGKMAEVSTGAYRADGRVIYVATDGGSERHVVQALDAASLALKAEYRQERPETAQILSIVPSPRGDKVAILIDSGNHSWVRLLDGATLAVASEVTTPLGAAMLGYQTEAGFPIGQQAFAADGAHFAISLSLPDVPDEIFLVETATGTLSPLRNDPRPGLAELPAIDATIEEVRAADGLTVPVNLYRPRGASGPLPLIVSLHGGPDASTSFSWSSWTRLFTSLGFAVAEPNIRGSTGFGRAYEMADDREKRVDAIGDLASVNQWARAQPWCDPDRIAIEGGSFGGYLVLMGLTRQPSLWSAGIDLAGPVDLTTFLSGANVPQRYRKEFGQDPALLASLSPLRDAGKIAAPLFVYHGQNDPRVPRAQADAMVRAVRARGISVEYMVPGDEGHTVARRANQVELLTRLLRFLGTSSSKAAR